LSTILVLDLFVSTYRLIVFLFVERLYLITSCVQTFFAFFCINSFSFFFLFADDIENLWMLSLVLKALLKFIQSGRGLPQRLFEPQFMQSIINLASMGTGFSKQWLVTDMEVCKLYPCPSYSGIIVTWNNAVILK